MPCRSSATPRSADSAPTGSQTKLPCGSGVVQPASRSAAGDPGPLGDDVGHATAHLVGRRQARPGRALCEVVHGERHERPIDHPDDLRVTGRVADTQRSQPVGLAERSGDHQIGMIGEQRGGVGDPEVVDELRIGLVEHDDAGVGNGVEQGLDLGGRHHGPGRVVGVRDERDLGPVGDRCGEGHQVEGFVAQRDPDLLGFDQPGEQRIRLERRPAHRHLVAGRDVGEQDLLQDPRRTRADGDLLDVDAQLSRRAPTAGRPPRGRGRG